MKKTIIHFIFNLTRGGAETMLVQVIKELEEYDHIVVTIFNRDHFGAELECKKMICMNLRSIFALPLAVLKFKKIIREYNPAFVHSHLIWPGMVARLATPGKIPLLTTIHTSVASAADYKKWYVKFFDKLTYKFRKSIIIVVSKTAYKEYFSFLNLKPYKAYVLYTFVDIKKFKINTPRPKAADGITKLVSVGSLRTAKNYFYLLEAFEHIKDEPIELHIYGTGHLQQALQKKIEETGVRVILKGEVNNVQEIIPQYDLYVMSSSFEGFSLSVLEAMAMNIPMLLSDIPSFREQCADTAIYFDLKDPRDLVAKLKGLAKDKNLQYKIAGAAKQRVLNNFTLEHHMQGLRKIYLGTLNNQ